MYTGWYKGQFHSDTSTLNWGYTFIRIKPANKFLCIWNLVFPNIYVEDLLQFYHRTPICFCLCLSTMTPLWRKWLFVIFHGIGCQGIIPWSNVIRPFNIIFSETLIKIQSYSLTKIRWQLRYTSDFVSVWMSEWFYAKKKVKIAIEITLNCIDYDNSC